MTSEAEVLERCIENSERISWRIADILPDDYQISYERPFLPATLTRENELSFLNPYEKKCLNHIWGAAYFNIFSFVEEYITTFSLCLANDSSFKEVNTLRAFVRFSEEEIKHQLLFKKYLEKFAASFVAKCGFLDNAREVASTILSNTKLCVLILTYHLELITQQHFVASIKSAEQLDEKFKEILKCHWLEEAQHSKLDLFKIKQIAREGDDSEFLSAMSEYFSIVDALVVILRAQVEMNYDSLTQCSDDKKKFADKENRRSFIETQHQAYVDLFVLMGFENKTFLHELGGLHPNVVDVISTKAESLRHLYQHRTTAEA